jgi:hypothetical protein
LKSETLLYRKASGAAGDFDDQIIRELKIHGVS